MKPLRFLSLVFLILIFAFSTFVYADVPQMINYQGKITTPQGALIDTIVSMTFTIYADSESIDGEWVQEFDSVKVEKGIFSVLLGSNNPIPDSVFDGSVRYLGVKVGDDLEMTPRKEIVSVAYAYKAGTAGGWVDDGTVLRLETDTDSVGIGTKEPEYKFQILGDNQTLVSLKSPHWHPGEFLNINWRAAISSEADMARIGVEAISDESGDMYFYTREANTTTLTSRMIIDGSTGNVGIGTTNPQGALDVNSTTGALIVPRMTTAQRDALTPVNGTIIYNTTANQFNFYENGAWVTK